MGEFGIGINPYGGGLPEHQFPPDPAEQAAAEMWERMGGYTVPEEWTVDQVDAKIAELENFAREMSQRAESFRRREPTAMPYRTSSQEESERAMRDVLVTKMKIAVLEARKAELTQGAAVTEELSQEAPIDGDAAPEQE